MTPFERRAGIAPEARCEVCGGEGIVSYIDSRSGFSEPSECYKCNGSGRRSEHSNGVRQSDG